MQRILIKFVGFYGQSSPRSHGHVTSSDGGAGYDRPCRLPPSIKLFHQGGRALQAVVACPSTHPVPALDAPIYSSVCSATTLIQRGRGTGPMKPRQPEIISRCQFRQTRSFSNERDSILEDERGLLLSQACSPLLFCVRFSNKA